MLSRIMTLTAFRGRTSKTGMTCICSRKIFIAPQLCLFMNQNRQLTAQLIQLKNIIKDEKAILEWHKLKVMEKNSNPSLREHFQDDTIQQLTDKQAAFQMLWAKTSMLLHDKTINLSRGKRYEFQKELNIISLQYYYLGSDVRVY